MADTRKPGGGRERSMPEYSGEENLKEQTERAAALYASEMSLQAAADEMGADPIKVRELLIPAGVYFPNTALGDEISMDAERQQRYKAVKKLMEHPCEDRLWECVVAFCGCTFKTLTGLPFTYTIKTGRNGNLTKELWIDRREGSKSLAWSSVLLAYRNIKEIGAVVERPKALGDIRGVSYIYGIFCRFGLIGVPERKSGR